MSALENIEDAEGWARAEAEIARLTAERDALAAQVEAYRERLDYVVGYIEEREDWQGREAIIADVQRDLALFPDISTEILRARDAEMLKEVEERLLAFEKRAGPFYNSIANAIVELRRMATDLEGKS